MFGMVGATFAIRLHMLGSFRRFREDRAVRANLVNIGLWTVIGFSLHVDNWAHGGGLVAGATTTWLLVRRASATRWAVFAVVYGAVVLTAARPWHKPTQEDLCKLYPRICETLPAEPPTSDSDH
jgi:hypothetical protein